jgi:dienelactone hydrolase
LLFALVMMLSGLTLSAVTQNSMGTVLVTEVDFPDTDGLNVHATLQQPYYASSTNPVPAVIVFHGSLQNKEWLMAFGIELSRRGFVVLTPDADGHGNSDNGADSGPASLDYLASLDYVDTSSIGVIGHSMGGGTVAQAIDGSQVKVRAVILVGSWVRPEWNATYPQNLLITVGDFDSLSMLPSDRSSLDATFNTTTIQENLVYGSFSAGTARKLVIARTNHLFETIDPEIVSQSVEWMKYSLMAGIEDEHWVPASSLAYPWWLFGGFFATLGLVLTIFPLMTVILDLPVFSQLKNPDPIEQKGEPVGRKWTAIYSILPAATFYPLLLAGTFIPFPQSYGAAISLWFLGTGIINLLLLKYPLKRNLREDLALGSQTSSMVYIKTFVVALIITLWLYAWTLFADLGLVLDFRCFLPGMNDLTISRALFVPIYAVVLMVYFLSDGVWLMGTLRPPDVSPWYKGQMIWSLRSIILKCLPFVILIGIEFGLGMLLGFPVVPGMIGYTFLFFYAFTPWFAVSAVITTWSFRSTKQYYLGALVNALLFAWMVATILAF